MLLSNPHLSFAAGFGTTLSQVAGFHRAVPSTTLDKACMQFVIYCSRKLKIVKYQFEKQPIVHNLFMDFSPESCYDMANTLSRCNH